MIGVTDDAFDGVLAQLLLLESMQIFACIFELVVWIFDDCFANSGSLLKVLGAHVSLIPRPLILCLVLRGRRL